MEDTPPVRDIVVLGASAGGLEALKGVVRALPADLPAALFVVLHIPATVPSLLPEILSKAGILRAETAVNGRPIEHGHIYVAPPDHHLMLDRGFIRVLRGARENGHRPAVDPLFRSAARIYGERVIGVVLSGTRDCGTAGLLDVKRRGGVAVVQDPAEALFDEMPRSALDNVPVDHCLPAAAIAPLLVKLAERPAVVDDIRPALPAATAPEVELTCPGCGGNLMRTEIGPALTFTCKVGHRYSPEGLAGEQAVMLEQALWVALRSIEDNIGLARRLATRAKDQNHPQVQQLYELRVRHGEEQATLVRRALLGPEAETTAPPLKK